MSVTYLPKNSATNQPSSGKYYIDCTKRITGDQPTTEAWLTVLDRLKPTNFQDTNRVLLGVLEKQKRVVIKIGESQLLIKEYKVGTMVSAAKVPCFMKYICYFECQDDYKEHPDAARKFLCKAPGKQMKCLVMKHYSMGSLGAYAWTPQKLDLLKTLLIQCVGALIMAFERVGIVHSDAHARNVLIEPTKKTTITVEISGKSYTLPTQGHRVVFMDFENTLLSTDRQAGRENVYRDVLRLVADLYTTCKLPITQELVVCASTLATSATFVPFLKGFKELVKSIGTVQWQDDTTTNGTDKLVYDPNRF